MLQILPRRAKKQELTQQARLSPREIGSRPTTIDMPGRRRLSLLSWTFILFVVLPTLSSGFYFAFIASNEYVSEAHFTIRKAGQSESSISDMIGAASSSLGMGTSTGLTTQDVFIVADYIRSRTIIENIGGKALLYEIYARPAADWLARLSSTATLEKIWKYWQRKVSAMIDTPSGIITLQVRAFTAEDSHRLALAILKSSEQLVNEISERSRHDALLRAEAELNRAEERVRKARIALLEFRNKSNLIDPMLTATSISDAINKLTQDRMTIEGNRASLGKSVSSSSPTLRVLNDQIATINQQIAGLQEKLTSSTKNSAISAQLTAYENLQIESQFAQRMYSVAQSGYEAARREQERQQLYLVTVDPPNLPTKATFPRLFLDTFTVFAACVILWSMAMLLVAMVRDHMGH